ncbi:hypothetical protein GCM10022323_16470 [Asaccharospora irregularis DSM 2635]
MLAYIYDIYYKDYTNSKYWYEKSRAQGCVESVYNLGQLNFKLGDYDSAEKYYKEGVQLGSKKCEYMLANLYYKKSIDMHRKLAKENYDDCSKIIESAADIKLDFYETLVPKFTLIEEKIDEEEYVPIYILDINENLEDMLDDLQYEMIIDEQEE